jgi:hypothetical protein
MARASGRKASSMLLRPLIDLLELGGWPAHSGRAAMEDLGGETAVHRRRRSVQRMCRHLYTVHPSPAQLPSANGMFPHQMRG